MGGARAAKPAVSIVILTKNEETRIGGCLRSVFAQDFDGSVEVLVIDSGSTDHTLDIVAATSARLLRIPPEEFHHGRTRHLGVLSTTAPLVVLLNGDATPADERWLSGLVQAVDRPEVGAAYSRQRPYPGAFPMEEFFLQFVYPPAPANGSAGHLRIMPTFFSTVSCILKRSAYELEPFSAAMIMSEDQEWSVRITRRNLQVVYAPESEVLHSHNYTLTRAFRRFFDAGMTAKASYLQRNPGNWTALLRRAVAYPFAEGAFLLRSGRAHWLPYAALYDLLKLLGFGCGLGYRFLPPSILQRVSLYATPATAGNRLTPRD